VIALDAGFLDGAVHPLDLSVCPRVVGFGQPMFDPMALTRSIKGMSSEPSRWAPPVLWKIGELNAVVAQNNLNLVRNSSHKSIEKGSRRGRRRLLDKLGKGEFARPVEGSIEIKLAFFRPHLSDVDVKEADRVSLEPLFESLSPSTSGSRLMPWRWRQRCRDERVRCGILGWSA
jgi:hypothetical protein